MKSESRGSIYVESQLAIPIKSALGQGFRDSVHLSRRNIFWWTIFQQPDARFREDVKVMFDLVVRRTPQDVGKEGHCLEVSFDPCHSRSSSP